MASATPTIRELLEGIKASEFPFTREIVCVDSKATTLDAFRTLSENHVLSAPVLDATAGKYVGFIDTSDLVKHIVETQTGVPKSPVAGALSCSLLPNAGLTSNRLATTLSSTIAYITKGGCRTCESVREQPIHSYLIRRLAVEGASSWSAVNLGF